MKSNLVDNRGTPLPDLFSYKPSYSYPSFKSGVGVAATVFVYGSIALYFLYQILVLFRITSVLPGISSLEARSTSFITTNSVWEDYGEIKMTNKFGIVSVDKDGVEYIKSVADTFWTFTFQQMVLRGSTRVKNPSQQVNLLSTSCELIDSSVNQQVLGKAAACPANIAELGGGRDDYEWVFLRAEMKKCDPATSATTCNSAGDVVVDESSLLAVIEEQTTDDNTRLISVPIGLSSTSIPHVQIALDIVDTEKGKSMPFADVERTISLSMNGKDETRLHPSNVADGTYAIIDVVLSRKVVITTVTPPAVLDFVSNTGAFAAFMLFAVGGFARIWNKFWFRKHIGDRDIRKMNYLNFTANGRLLQEVHFSLPLELQEMSAE